MTRTPDEIKKELECCSSIANCADGCPYHVIIEGSFGCEEMGCEDGLLPDALALIQQLEKRAIHLEALNQSNLNTITMQERTRARLQERISQLEAERDAAVADITRMVQEPYDPCYCDYCKLTEEECAKSNCRGRSAFVWRGLQKEETP